MLSKKHVEDVRVWHNTFLIKPATRIAEVQKFLDLRTRIMIEEINEYFDAGVDLIERADAITDMYFIAHGTLALFEDTEPDLREFMIDYMEGTFKMHCRLLEFLTDLPENKIIAENLNDLFLEVLRSNHTKADKDGNPIFREDGKLIKSELFEEPNLKKVLFYEDN